MGAEPHGLASPRRSWRRPPPPRAWGRQFRQRRLECWSRRENHGTLDEVFKLAHIAGPVIVRHGSHRRGRDRLDPFVHAARICVHKVPHEENVFPPLAQRRDHDGEDVQPVMRSLRKCFSATSCARSAFVAAIRRASVCTVRVLPSRSNTLLEDPQQLGLQIEGQITDFVEKHRPAVRQLEAADAWCNGAGERAFLVAEEFAFEQACGDRRTVELHEGVLRCDGCANGSRGRSPLCRPRLAREEHGRIGGRHELNRCKTRRSALCRRSPRHGGRCGEHLRRSVSLGRRMRVCRALRAVVQRLRDGAEQVLVAERFRQEVDGPGFHGAHRHGDVAVAGDENNRQRRRPPGQFLLHSSPLRPGSWTSSTRQPGAVWPRAGQKLVRRGKGLDGEPRGAEQIAQTLAHGLVVVYDKDVGDPQAWLHLGWSPTFRRVNTSSAGCHDGVSAASIAWRSSSRQGLDKTATAPAARARARTSSSAYAVTKMIGIGPCAAPS